MSKIVIDSRPKYGTLEVCNGEKHLFIADGEGAEAILALRNKADKNFWHKSRIFYIPDSGNTSYQQQLEDLEPEQFFLRNSVQNARGCLDAAFQEHLNTWQVYAAGSEGLIGLVKALAFAYGYPFQDIQTEQRGTLARPVQCVHCKTLNEKVTTDPFQCKSCGLHLFVRDHYSLRLGCFQGVCIDAEDPGNVPKPEVVFE